MVDKVKLSEFIEESMDYRKEHFGGLYIPYDSLKTWYPDMEYVTEEFLLDKMVEYIPPLSESPRARDRIKMLFARVSSRAFLEKPSVKRGVSYEDFRGRTAHSMSVNEDDYWRSNPALSKEDN